MTERELLLFLGDSTGGPTTVHKVRHISRMVTTAYKSGDTKLLAEWVSILFLTVKALQQDTSTWMVDWSLSIERHGIDIEEGYSWPDRLEEIPWSSPEHPATPGKVEDLPYLSALIDVRKIEPLSEFARFILE
jgi:hypothetical protein